jgi:hypothetical protein
MGLASADSDFLAVINAFFPPGVPSGIRTDRPLPVMDPRLILTLVVLYPKLKETSRERRWGLSLTMEDVKLACGPPQADGPYQLKYIVGNRYMELSFLEANHRMFLQNVKFHAVPDGVPSGQIYKVTQEQISDYVKKGFLPACLEQAVQ